MKIHNLVVIMASLILIVGCSVQTPAEQNIIQFPTSEGTSYLDASREVIYNQNWTHVRESGTTTNGETTVVMIGSSEGKNVYFTLPPAKSKTSMLEVKTEVGFPLQPEQILELVKEEYNK